MRVIDYFRHTGFAATCVFAVVAITDAVLFTSSAINMAFTDIIYLNLLIFLVSLSFFSVGYFRFRSIYSKLRDALESKNDIDYLLPEDSSFFSTLIRDAVNFKSDQCLQKIHFCQSSMDELNEYITKWVHEIKIPISVCELVVENMKIDNYDNSRNLRLELERMKFLVNQVLHAGRAADYNKDLSVSEFCLERTVKDAVKRNARFLILKDIEVCIEQFSYTIINDEKWVAYILDQILNNAGKYTGKNGRVEVNAYEDDKAIHLHIRDSGIGIPSGDLRRVFDKGFTGENGRKTTKSTGMGMYYSKKIADRLGIVLDVSSSVGEYTDFKISFLKLNDYFNVT